MLNVTWFRAKRVIQRVHRAIIDGSEFPIATLFRFRFDPSAI